MSAEVVVALVGAVLTGLGAAELLRYVVKRRDDRSDARDAERRTTAKELSVVEADANRSVLDVLLREMRDRIDSYEQMIREMKDQHSRDIADVKAENRLLDRQVRDLQITLRDWQLGNRTPRGQVLIPIREVRDIRDRAPGLLNSNWYPGEDAEPVGGEDQSVIARITPMQHLDPQQGGE